MWFFIITIILLFLSGAANGVVDHCQFHYKGSRLEKWTFNNRYWWDADRSWQNKYISGDPENGRTQITIFGFSFTKPVQLTDAFHFFKMIDIILQITSVAMAFNCLIIQTDLVSSIILIGILGFVRNMGFKATYNWVLQ